MKKITKGNAVSFCKVCEITLANHKPVLNKHLNSCKHIRNWNAIKNCKPIEQLVTSNHEDHAIKRAEIKICTFLANNNLPFSLSDSFIPFLANTLPDSKIARKIHLGRTKATNIVTRLVGPAFKQDIINIISTPGNFFSIIMDETTDISVKKQCAFCVIYYHPDNEKVETHFLDLFETESGKAEDLSEALLNWLRTNSVPFENFIGFSSDTTNVMAGAHNSVFSHLKKSVKNIVCIKCSCHLIHLVASKACAKLPGTVEDMLRSIAGHFCRSSKRISKLQEFQNYFQVENYKILSPAATRWLSLKSCVDRTLDQYTALTEYFRLELFENPTKGNQEIFDLLSNDITKIYLEFMSYTLELLNDFNLIFQAEKPRLHLLQSEVEKLIKTIASNYLEFNYVKATEDLKIEFSNPNYFLPIEKIYLGVLAHTSLATLKEDQHKKYDLLKNCQSFYIEVLKQINLKFVFTDEIFNIINMFNLKEAQSFKEKDLTVVLNKFPSLLNFIDQNALHKEWREHALLNHEELGLNSDMAADEYWEKVFNLKNVVNEPMFKNLKKVVCLTFVLPFSNACVERIFSQLKLIKTDHRNRLNTNTIAALIMVKENIKDVSTYDPPKSMITSSAKVF